MNKRNFSRKPKRKSDKVRLIILEGESDKHFFMEFKKRFNLRSLEPVLLGKNLNFHRIDREIKFSLDALGYKEVWLVMDLKSQKIGTTDKIYSSTKEMIRDYKLNLKNLDHVDYIVMVQDLEGWLLLYYATPGRKNTENVKNTEKKLRRAMNTNESISKVTMVKRLTRNRDFWEILRSNRQKNKSFNYFLEKVDTALLKGK
ncbi:MAG: hypothetical protein GY757_52455 [bacterium]|nr:hypothetical protein [bacterium]